MSGSSHNYAYEKIDEAADEFQWKGYSDDHGGTRKKVYEILKMMSKICHDIEWIDSCDYGKDSWIDVEKILSKIIK
jgi:hypothetical protein